MNGFLRIAAAGAVAAALGGCASVSSAWSALTEPRGEPVRPGVIVINPGATPQDMGQDTGTFAATRSFAPGMADRVAIPVAVPRPASTAAALAASHSLGAPAVPAVAVGSARGALDAGGHGTETSQWLSALGVPCRRRAGADVSRVECMIDGRWTAIRDMTRPN